jgi:hypothetical protein
VALVYASRLDATKVTDKNFIATLAETMAGQSIDLQERVERKRKNADSVVFVLYAEIQFAP